MAAECRYVLIARGDQTQFRRECDICGLGPCERYSAAAVAPTQPWRSLPAAEREPTKVETAASSAEYRQRVETVEVPRSFFVELVDLLYIASSTMTELHPKWDRVMLALVNARNFGWKPQEERRGG